MVEQGKRWQWLKFMFTLHILLNVVHRGVKSLMTVIRPVIGDRTLLRSSRSRHQPHDQREKHAAQLAFHHYQVLPRTFTVRTCCDTSEVARSAPLSSSWRDTVDELWALNVTRRRKGLSNLFRYLACLVRWFPTSEVHRILQCTRQDSKSLGALKYLPFFFCFGGGKSIYCHIRNIYKCAPDQVLVCIRYIPVQPLVLGSTKKYAEQLRRTKCPRPIRCDAELFSVLIPRGRVLLLPTAYQGRGYPSKVGTYCVGVIDGGLRTYAEECTGGLGSVCKKSNETRGRSINFEEVASHADSQYRYRLAIGLVGGVLCTPL